LEIKNILKIYKINFIIQYFSFYLLSKKHTKKCLNKKSPARLYVSNDKNISHLAELVWVVLERAPKRLSARCASQFVGDFVRMRVP